jgi:beta-glucosidase
MWGAATSAHQVEGDNCANDWWRFEQRPEAIAAGVVSGSACRHFENHDTDFGLAQADGHNAHRLSFEWSRLEPEPGRFDAEAVAHYHAVLASLRRRGLTPLVTLHHFTNPLWIADAGGWTEPATIDAFCRFVRFCAREYGAEVDWWCTVNEPEVYAFRSYSEGVWPPGMRDDGLALAVIANLLEAHGRAYHVLHEEDHADADGDGHAAIVGFAKHLVHLEPARWWMPLDVLRAAFEDRVFNDAVSRAALTGDLHLWIPGARGVRRHVPELRGALDYFGLNHYTRWQVRGTGPVPHTARAGAPLNDLGWEVWPDGLRRAVLRADGYARAIGAMRTPNPARIPVVVTEHGFADARDAFRPRALAESLAALHHAIQQGAYVRGYFHWSLLDNFEWSDGYAGRFGLYRIDFDRDDRPRERTHSADVYAAVARSNSLEEPTSGA